MLLGPELLHFAIYEPIDDRNLSVHPILTNLLLKKYYIMNVVDKRKVLHYQITFEPQWKYILFFLSSSDSARSRVQTKEVEISPFGVNNCQFGNLCYQDHQNISILGRQMKDEQEGIDNNNPFNFRINAVESDNPFQIRLGGNQDFFNQINQNCKFQSNQQKDQVSNQYSGQQPKKQSEPRLAKIQSKQQAYLSDQNIKKYKEVLKSFYNYKYSKSVENLEESLRYSKKQSSQQFRVKPDSCFKGIRFQFHKQHKSKVNIYQKPYQFLLIRELRHKQIVVYELSNSSPIKNLKPASFKLQERQQICSSIQYDTLHGRIYCFSNVLQQILVIGIKGKQIICRIKLKYPRQNPSLYLSKYKSNLYLFVVGGYSLLNDSMIVEGCKYIQIFNVGKWEISLKQVILRLGIGRISPIIFNYNYQNGSSLFLLGGCSYASVTSKNKLMFASEEDINFATNQTGVKIDLSFVQDCFLNDFSNNLVSNNINIRFESPLQLFAGTVLFRKSGKNEKLELFLPKKREIFTLKLLKDDIHIIDSEIALNQPISQEGTINRSICYYSQFKNMQVQLYWVDEKGKLVEIRVHINQKKFQVKGVEQKCQLI